MRVFLVIAAALAVAGFLYFSFSRAPMGDGGVSVGQPAPDFTAQTLDGQTLKLADLRGKVVVLDFWATWCPPCRAMIPHERELVKKNAGKPFVFISVSADKTADILRDFVRANDMNWPHVFDGQDGPLQQLYQIEYFPSIFVLDGEGIVRYKDVRESDLDKAVDTLLAGLLK
jgi:thiol-disulfide isomerase/thioredoxin